MNYFEQFLEHLKSNHYAESTIETYRRNYRRIRKNFPQLASLDEREITEKHITDFLRNLKASKVTVWVYKSIINQLKIYFDYLEKQKIIFLSPLRDVKIPKPPKNRIKALSHEEINQFFSKINTSNRSGIRHRAILELMYSSALRTGEVANIKLSDIDFNKQLIMIRMAKRKKDRVVPVGKEAIKWIEKYMKEIRPRYVKDNDENYLFIPFQGSNTKLNTEAIYAAHVRMIKTMKSLEFRPYSLRVSSATHLLHNGMGVLHLKKFLGHSFISTTEIYLRVKTFNLRKAIETKHPANRKESTREALK